MYSKLRLNFKRTAFFGLCVLIAAFCALAIVGHEGGEEHKNTLSEACATACHTHSQAVFGTDNDLRQLREEDHDPSPPLAWLQIPVNLARLFIAPTLALAGLWYVIKLRKLVLTTQLRI